MMTQHSIGKSFRKTEVFIRAITNNLYFTEQFEPHDIRLFVSMMTLNF